MIDPDGYIDQFYIVNKEALAKPPKNRHSNFNYSRLSNENKLVQIKIEIKLKEDLIINERIDWDLTKEKKSAKIFGDKLVDGLIDIIDEGLIEYNKENIKNQILDSLLLHVEKNTSLPRLHLIKKDNDIISNNQLCINCNTVIFNQEYCVNCMHIFEKKEKKQVEKVDPEIDEFRQTERQRILELRQKNVEIEDLVGAEVKDKKICKKCGEINFATAIDCKNCKLKFPFITYFDTNVDQTYSVHFWDKINKNSIIQQLKSFSNFFLQEDFCNLKYLLSKIKSVVKKEYEEVLTEDAYYDLMYYLDKTYYYFSNPTSTTEKVFDAAYYTKHLKNRPKFRMLNFNNLVDIKEGWLNDTFADKNMEEKFSDKLRNSDPNLKKKRGRPKKMDIFKADLSKFNDTQITMEDRDNLLKSDFIPDDDVHYDFCGKCGEEGKLICCETCSSSFHFDCLGYDRVNFLFNIK